MKRFYQDVTVAPKESGWHLQLDGREVKTPARRPLHLATSGLAEAVAEEWRTQGEKILPMTMPLTQLAHAACDLDDADRARIVEHLAGYAATELLCYRDPRGALRRAQEAAWEPWLAWAERRFDVGFVRAEGLMPVAQAGETLTRMREAVASQAAEILVALNALCGVFGSLVLALAVREAALTTEEAFAASRLEHDFQEERWGTDAESARAADRLMEEARVAERFLHLCRRV